MTTDLNEEDQDFEGDDDLDGDDYNISEDDQRLLRQQQQAYSEAMQSEVNDDTRRQFQRGDEYESL